MAARGFSLTAEINLRGPTNIRPIVNNIRRQLGSINANVNLNINRTTLGSIRQVNTSLGTLNTTLAATTSSTTSAAQAFTNLAAAMRSVGNVNLPQTVQAPMVRLASSANNASAAVSRTRTEFEDFGRQAGLAVRRFAAFSAVTSVIYGFSNALSAGIKQYIEFDRQITRLSQVTNESKASLSGMTSEITRLSTGMGVASEDLAQVSVTLAQAGFSAADTRKALEALAKSALAPSFDNLNQTVEGSIALMRQFGISANQLEGALGSINAVAAGFAVEASDLIAAIQRTGGVFASASRGVSSGTDALNEFLAIFTSVRATTRESAETIATGLRTIFTRIQRGDTIEALKEYGVQLTDLEGKFVGPYVAVQRLAEGLGRLDPRDLKFSQIVEELGGFRQIGKVLPLIQQFATAQDALKVAQQGQGSLATDAAKGQLALAVQIQKVREEFTALVRSVGDSDGFKTMVRLGLDLASALIKIADATKGVLPLIGIMAAFRGVSALTQFAGGFGGGFRGTRRASEGGRIYGFARGGIVPGSGNTDSVPAMLTPGEFVVNKRAVNKYGRGNLVRMNQYAKGGPISIDELKTINPNSVQPDYRDQKAAMSKVGEDDDTWSKYREDGRLGKIRTTAIKYMQPQDEVFGDVVYTPVPDPTRVEVEKYFGNISFPKNTQVINPKNKEIAVAYERYAQSKMKDIGARFTGSYDPLDFETGDVKFYSSEENIEKYASWDKVLSKRLRHENVNNKISWRPNTPEIKKLPATTLYHPTDLSTDNNLKNKIFDWLLLSQSQKTAEAIRQPEEFSLGGWIPKLASGGSPQYTWSENKSFYDRANAKRTWYDVFEHGDKGESKVVYSGSFDDVFNFLQKKRVQNSEQQGINEKFVGGLIQKFMQGGLVQRFAEAGAVKETKRIRDRVSALAQTKGKSIKETILEQLKGLGGPAGVRTILGIGSGDSRTRSVLNANNIKANKEIETAKDYVNRALFVSGKGDAAESKRIAGLTKVAIAGLLPMGYSDTNEWTLPESGKTIYATIKGFDKEYLPAAQQMSKETALAARNLAENMQYTKIFGGKEKLVFDFDETLVSGVDILNDQGKPDIPRYSDRTVVEEYLKRGRLTRLGEKLKTLIAADPDFINNTRILTARPANTVDLLAQSLQGFGLPYTASNITGVGGEGVNVPTAKAQNLAKTEKLIDDSLDNIRSVQKNKKSGFLYTEPQAKPELDELMGQGNIEGAVIEKALAILGANLPPIETLESNRAIDFPGGLGRAAQFFNLPDNIPTEIKRTLNGSAFEKARGEFDRFYKEQAIGLADGGTVPALVSNGEAYVPPKIAKRIGYGKLNKMNQADRNGMGRFADGGISVFKGPGTGTSDSIPANLPVGSFILREKATKALGLNRGGAVGVQRFFFGGGPSARPNNPSLSSVGIDRTTVNILTELSNVLTELGVSSAATTQILTSGRQASYQSAIQAAEADIRRAKVAGASADQIRAAEDRLGQIRNQANRDIQTRTQLSGASGEQLQNIDMRVDDKAKRLEQAQIRRLQQKNPGMTRDQATEEVAKDRQKYRDLAYLSEARDAGLNTSGLKGEDIQRYISQSMKDRKTLAQMDAQYRTTRMSELQAAGRTASEAKKLVDQELKERREVVNNMSAAAGEPGPGKEQRFDKMQMGFAISTIGSLVSSNIDPTTSDSNAQLAAGIGGFTLGLGSAQTALGALESVGVKLPGVWGQVASLAIAFGQSMIDARNASIKFQKEFETKKVESELEKVGQLFEKFEKNLGDNKILNEINNRLTTATDSAIKAIEVDTKTAKAFWLNMIDAFASNDASGASSQQAAAKRSKVLEQQGSMAYLRSTGFGQAMGGGFMLQNIKEIFGIGGALRPVDKDGNVSTSGDMRAAQELAQQFSKLIPNIARDNSRQFQSIAQNLNRVFEEKLKTGTSLEDILNDPAWSKQAEALARSNAAVEAEILSVQNRTDISSKEKQARTQNIIAIEAEKQVRQQATIIARDREIKALQTSTTRYVRSLERMYQNMEQSINATAYALDIMKSNIELVSVSLGGQARAGEAAIRSINIIQNPRAYRPDTVDAARSVGSQFFGPRQAEMQSLLAVGENIEQAVLSTINNVLQQNQNITTEALGRKVDTEITKTLERLGLPPDLADKLAGEVKNVLADMRKQGDDTVDYDRLAEKLGTLNNVVDSARRAQEVAIKALEHFQNALNMYVQNNNKIIDLQIQTNDRYRKATDITATAQLELERALGKVISVETVRANVVAKTTARTGGLSDPNDIFDNILKLENQRRSQQNASDLSANRGINGVADFVRFQKDLKNTSIQLRENIGALEELANNTDVAAAAMEKVREAQQKQTGKVSFIEKIVTSTPEELEDLSRSFVRLQNNINGQVNTIQNSVGAQKAYQEAIQNGANQFDAMKAAQIAFTNERKSTLSALNDILPFLGDGAQAGNLKANVLQSMLMESGIGVSPMFQDILNVLRNPEVDPATAIAIQEYKVANNLQSDANRLLAQLNERLADDIAQKSAQALAGAIASVPLNFANNELKDIRDNVQAIRIKVVGNNNPAQPQAIARGGIVYASAGQEIVNYQPKGTDTVPAMLTPGEFVVNRAATQQNLPLLKAINSKQFSRGGSVKYYSSGGYVSSLLKPSYRGSAEGLETTTEKYIDPATLSNANQYAYRGPTQMVFSQKTLPPWKSTPATAGAYWNPLSDDVNRILDLPVPERGQLLPGAAPVIQNYSGSTLRSEQTEDGKEARTWYQNAMSYYTNQPKPFSNNAPFLGALFPDTIKTKNITKEDYESYKRQLLATKLKNFWKPPKLSDFTSSDSLSPSTKGKGLLFDPNIYTKKPVGLYLTSNPSSMQLNTNEWSTSPDVAKLYWTNVPGSVATTLPFTLSPTSSANAETIMHNNDHTGKTVNLDGLNVGTNGLASAWQQGDVLEKMLKQQDDHYQNYTESLAFAADPNVATFNKGGSNRLAKIKLDLENLYKGSSVFATLHKPDISTFIDPTLLDSENVESDLHILSESLDAKLKEKLNTPGIDKTLLGLPHADKIEVGLKPPFPKGIPAWAEKGPIDIGIYDRGAIRQQKYFPWVLNADPSAILGATFQEEQKKLQDSQRSGSKYGFSYRKQDLANQKLAFRLPGFGNVELPYNMMYGVYRGPLYGGAGPVDDMGFNVDAAGRQIFFPQANADRAFLFESSGDKLNPFDQLAAATMGMSSIYSYNQPADLNPILSTYMSNNRLVSDYIKAYISDPAKALPMENMIRGLSVRASMPAIKRHLGAIDRTLGIGADIPVFSENMGLQNYNLPIGDYIIGAVNAAQASLKEKAAAQSRRATNTPDTTIADQDIGRVVQNIAKQSLRIFGNMPMGLSQKLYASIRGVPNLLSDRPLGGKNRYGKDNPQAKQVSQYLSSVFDETGRQLSTISGRSPNKGIYDRIKQLYILASGAKSAFAGLAGGDTALIGAFARYGSVEGLLKTLGTGSAFKNVSSAELSQDYQRQLGRQLVGSKIATVGADGSVNYANAEQAIPKNYQGLFELVFNPYNKFAQSNIRQSLMNRLYADIESAKDFNGMPYFDPETLQFINQNFKSLANWYGGSGRWPGQDYFFDKNKDPDDNNRTNTVISALKTPTAQQIRTVAGVANRNLGVESVAGQLPDSRWFEANKVVGLARGGMVYANQGMMIPYEPRGTDTVPAMLTPGEFVVNRAATQKNLPLLKSINNGSQAYANGGVVYAAEGGEFPKGRVRQLEKDAEDRTRSGLAADEARRQKKDQAIEQRNKERDAVTYQPRSDLKNRKPIDQDLDDFDNANSWRIYTDDAFVNRGLHPGSFWGGALTPEDIVASAPSYEQRRLKTLVRAGKLADEQGVTTKDKEDQNTRQQILDQIYQNRDNNTSRLERISTGKDTGAVDETDAQKLYQRYEQTATDRFLQWYFYKSKAKAGESQRDFLKRTRSGWDSDFDFDNPYNFNAVVTRSKGEAEERFVEELIKKGLNAVEAFEKYPALPKKFLSTLEFATINNLSDAQRESLFSMEDRMDPGMEALNIAIQQMIDKKNKQFAEAQKAQAKAVANKAAQSRPQSKATANVDPGMKMFSQIAERRWEDSTGQHSTIGTLQELIGDKVRISKLNGKTTLMPVSQLSTADQNYVRELQELRNWTDDTGKYKTQARVIGVGKQGIIIQKLDGSTKNVPMNRLSKQDQDYLYRMYPQYLNDGASFDRLTRTVQSSIPKSSLTPGREYYGAQSGVATPTFTKGAPPASSNETDIQFHARVKAAVRELELKDIAKFIAAYEREGLPILQAERTTLGYDYVVGIDGKARVTVPFEDLDARAKKLREELGVSKFVAFPDGYPGFGSDSNLTRIDGRGIPRPTNRIGTIIDYNFNKKYGTALDMIEEYDRRGTGMTPSGSAGGYATGGVVYAQEGQLVNYQPRGTDTVPAMLTPGEFVVNRAATQKNLPLLRAINSNNYSNGGVVYMKAGDTVDDPRRAAANEQAEKNQMNRKEIGSFSNALARRIVVDIHNNPSMYDAINTNAINENPDVDARYNEYVTDFNKIEPNRLYQYAKSRYMKNLDRYNYLNNIITNIDNALKTLSNGNDLDKKVTLNGQRGILGDILRLQTDNAKTERDGFDRLWLRLGDRYPQLTMNNRGQPNVQQNQAPAAFADGGMVYANNGMLIPYQPKGTDTVPAMLTPGEFVVNRESTRQNLGLLRAINSNSYANGGVVKYLSEGTAGGLSFTKILSSFTSGIQRAAAAIDTLLTTLQNTSGGVNNDSGSVSVGGLDGLGQFTAKFDQFITQLSKLNLPPEINVNGNHKVEVVINGAQALQSLLDGPLSGLIRREVQSAFSRLNAESEGSIPDPTKQ